MSKRLKLSRRGFLVLAGASAVAVGAGSTAYALRDDTPATGHLVNAFAAITPSGDIEFVCPGEDLGQGAPVALAMILAEEIGADLSRVRILPAPRDAARFGNPDFAGRMVTAYSKTTLGYWPLLRLAGAEMRRALIATAAGAKGWRVAECRAENHSVLHIPSNTRLSFSEVISAGDLKVPGAAQGDLKPAEEFTLLGNSPQRPDAINIVTGRKAFGTDVRQSGTLVAVVKRSARLGDVVATFDEAAARAVPGVAHLHLLGDQSAVAVVASDTWSAIKGAEALKISWTSTDAFDSTTERQTLTAALDDPAADPVALRGQPQRSDSAQASLFYAPALTHVLPEPLNATVEGQSLGLGARITSATQSLDLDMRYGAKTWKTAPFMIETRSTPSGGSYGRRVLNDAVRDAAEIAKAVGQPVQVIRTQLDEMQRGQVRPAAVQRLSGRIDAEGKLAEWRHEIVSDGTLSTHLPSSLKGEFGTEDNTATDGVYHPYTCTDQSVSWTRVASAPSPGFLRGVSASYTVRAIETMIERLARQAGHDPLEWRIKNVQDARLRAVLRRVREISGWGDPDRALGLGAMIFRGARVASVAEIHNTEVAHIWIAVDVGQVVHRKQLLAQVQGGAVWGLSQALYEGMTYRDGAAGIESLADYPMISNGNLPPIDIDLVQTPGLPPAGAGEVGVPSVIAAICNAAEAASGRMFNDLPLLLEELRK
jgi:isoquinoline 1-oxidoreductase beta subunit